MKSIFSRLKLGDRFFYEHDFDKNVIFTEDQLNQIKNVSFARILCDNIEGLRAIQPMVNKKKINCQIMITFHHSEDSINANL